MYGGNGIRPARSSSCSTGSSPRKRRRAEPSSALSTIALDAFAKVDDVTHAGAPGIAQKRLPFAWPFTLVQRRTDARVAALAFELRRNDLGVVEHQHVARLKQPRQIEHLTVGDVGAIDQQQPRTVARARWSQRNPLPGSSKSKGRRAWRAARL